MFENIERELFFSLIFLREKKEKWERERETESKSDSESENDSKSEWVRETVREEKKIKREKIYKWDKNQETFFLN